MNDQKLQYRQLQHDDFGDTLLAATRSNKYNEIFVTEFGCSREFPMAKKGDAHEVLSLFSQRDGVPPKIIVDVSKEQTLGDFKRKVAEAGCHLRQIEPESLCKMAVEGEISELKRGPGRNMT